MIAGKNCVEFREFLEKGVISPERMRAVDTNAQGLGVSAVQLMECAGKGLADYVRGMSPGHVVLLCGKGNNGGDGFVAARHLCRDCMVTVIVLSRDIRSGEALRNFHVLSHCGVDVIIAETPDAVCACRDRITSADVVIDAMLGTGIAGGLREPYATCARVVCESCVPVVAADVPTPGLPAAVVCSFHRAKEGEPVVIDIGIPDEAECFTGPGDLLLLRKKGKHSHKGVGGEVLVIGGGPYQGAPYLAGMAAIRAGADIVRVATPNLLPCPDLIVERTCGQVIGEDDVDRLAALAQRADVTVCGCGLGTESHGVISKIAGDMGRAVFDADALSLPLPVADNTIYTPHAGEFFRMTGCRLPEDPVGRGRMVRDHGPAGVTLAKGPVDVISDNARVRFNRAGTPHMTVGGTGDVLAGIVGALFCHLPAFEAAAVGAYVNGSAGESLQGLGDGLAATDLLKEIPMVLSGIHGGA
ncbi:NAD(P)H-hydrate dehydratase [Methanogenium organophilum]|uniref:ADP-dependent (S)-NAD(P)H-hydrate dehydratase n=1 Tax=Methanogenium organophilum TaxID=2199 RepID=A0A9X9S477_METOG|nr:NAD(P)H-hydrate dehydratase [Methanogenium organophilum]WAI01639.1 NAD(P)H-hydrate dehydratase [Methanogenium organophilum]